MVRLAGDMDYLSRKLMMSRRILPASAMPERGEDASWRESAACLGADTELFFPVGFTGPAAADIRAARAFCERCPVRACCLAYALDTGQTAGIWGGYDENERRLMRQGQPASIQADCQTAKRGDACAEDQPIPDAASR